MREHLPAPEVASPSPARPAPVARTPVRQPVRTPAAGPMRQLARDHDGRGMGNRATIATLARAGVRVTSPTDQVEREAAAVADAAVRAPAPAPVVAVAPAEETVARKPARERATLLDGRASSGDPLPRATSRRAQRGIDSGLRPDLRDRSVGQTTAARMPSSPGRSPRAGFAQTPLARAASDTPASQPQPAMPKARAVQRNSPAMPRGPPSGLPPVVAAGFSGGNPVAPGVRDRIEPTLGADLSQMRVHTGPDAERAATSVSARAFTIGSDVVLGPGERADDVALMAHEATHVVQQTPGAFALAREETEDDSLIPDFILDEVRSVVRSIPGYTLVAAAIGQDPLTGQPVTLELDNAVETLLLAGPFGPGVAVVLKAMDLLSSAWTVVTTTLASHRITVARIGEDIDAAWDRFTVANRIDGNVAIVRGYINAFLADIRAAIGDLVDQLIQAVRDAIVPIVEPYLIEGPLAPVWNLATKVMHYNPLTGADVTASTVEIISDFLTLIGQDEVLAQMTERGTLQETADWVDTQIATFLSLIGRAGQLFSDAWDAISPANLPNLLDTLPDLANRAVALFGDVVEFGSTLISQILIFVRDSLLEWLSEKAHTMRGFKLLTVILGANPFTGAGVERNAENLIGGFIELIAGPDTYAQLAESGVIAEAAGKIESEMDRLNISWDLITGTFTAIWESLSLTDFLDPIGCIMRVIDQFGEPLSRIISFAATVVQVVLELILRLMNFPGDLLGSIIAGVQQALDNIQADPVGFLNNLLAALKQGFSQFFDNILTHLVQGLADWLFRGLRGMGIEIPTELSGEAILKLALDVMGLSVEFLWECLGEVIGQERVAMIRGAIDRLGQAWAFIADVQARGMVAVWEYISSQLGNLWDTILTMAKDWLVSNIIDAAIAKVLSMLDPTGVMAVINSCIAFYRAVQSVIEYVTEILQIVKTYVDTIAAIAAGNIAPGATMLEGGLAAAIPVAIGFLASQVGLGDIPEKIVEIINGLRQAIKDAVIWLIRQAMRLGEAALNALGFGGDPAAAEPEAAGRSFTIDQDFTSEGVQHEISNVAGGIELTMASNNPTPLDQLGSDEMSGLYAAYRAAVAAVSPPASATEEERQAAYPAMKAAADQHIPAIVECAKKLGDQPPRASAPGLGTVAPHNSQQSGRKSMGSKEWNLESEHVIPRGFTNALFTALGEAGIPMASPDYGAQHTVLIYHRAAQLKTWGKGDISLNVRYKQTIRTGLTDIDRPSHADSVAEAQEKLAFVDAVHTRFNELTADAVGRTVAAISAENAEASQYSGMTNGESRGAEGSPEPPSPGADAVSNAAAQQRADIDRQWNARMDAVRRELWGN